jgi:hypothetical protein
MTQEQIDKINALCPEDQGIFKEPYGIDTNVKEHVVYMRWCTGGMKGGGYHIDSHRHSFDGDGRPSFFALQMVLKELGVDPIMENSRIVKSLTQEGNLWNQNEDYYGNYEDFSTEYIVLSELEKAFTNKTSSI